MSLNLDKMAKQRRPWQMAIINATRVCIAALWPRARVEVFGSFATGYTQRKLSLGSRLLRHLSLTKILTEQVICPIV